MRLLYLLLTVLPLLMAGCVGFKPSEDPTRFYLLSSANGAPPPELAKDGLRVGIRRIAMPDYLHTSKITLRKGEHEILYSDFNRWGEDIDVAVSRALLQTLTRELQARYVSVFPWPSELDHDYLVRLAFTAFEGTNEGTVLISGHWTIIEPKTRKVLHAHTFEHKGFWEPKRYETLAGTLSSLLNEMGGELSGALLELEALPDKGD